MRVETVHPGKETPRASLLFLACDQSEYILPAIRSALNQTGIVLEIIMSDDSSRDATPKIMRREIEKYRGPHRVILRHNIERIGLDHFHDLNAMASCDFRIMAHGDDISQPTRCMKLWQSHEETGASVVWSGREVIDAIGRVRGTGEQGRSRFIKASEFFHEWPMGYCGAVIGWHSEVYDHFPALVRATVPFNHDFILGVRASLLGGCHFIKERLVHYRVHKFQQNLRFATYDNGALYQEQRAWRTISAQRMALQDLDFLIKTPPPNINGEKIPEWRTQKEELENIFRANCDKWIERRIELHADGYYPRFLTEAKAQTFVSRFAERGRTARRAALFASILMNRLRNGK